MEAGACFGRSRGEILVFLDTGLVLVLAVAGVGAGVAVASGIVADVDSLNSASSSSPSKVSLVMSSSAMCFSFDLFSVRTLLATL